MTNPTRPADTVSRRRTREGKDKVQSWVSTAVLGIFALVFLVPLIWMVATALKPSSEVFSTPPALIGSSVQFQNFIDAWNYLPFGRFMLNSLLVAGAGTILNVITSALAAYAFSRVQWRGRSGVFFIYLMTLMVPQEVLAVPMFIMMQKFGWVNSYVALILPWAFSAFGTFLLRQFMLSLPDSLEEAAMIDGASRLRIFVQIIVPLTKPALLTLGVFTFIGYWNSFLWPLLIISDVKMATVPLGLNMFLGQTGNQWNLLMAAATISIVPAAVMVALLQKYLVQGIAMSGMGGR